MQGEGWLHHHLARVGVHIDDRLISLAALLRHPPQQLLLRHVVGVSVHGWAGHAEEHGRRDEAGEGHPQQQACGPQPDGAVHGQTNEAPQEVEQHLVALPGPADRHAAQL